MIEVDGRALLVGLAAGLPASALYFAGLGWGVRCALRARRPALLLLASFVARAALLLGLAAWLAGRTQPLGTLAGYGLAFAAVRALAVRGARAGAPRTATGNEGS